MTPNEQEILDILSDRVYVMVTIACHSISGSNRNFIEQKRKILHLSSRMTKEEIVNKYNCLDLAYYPAHYKTPETLINFWFDK